MIKIVAISYLHGQFPKVPKCDLLIVAGDICPDRVYGVYARHAPDWQLKWFENNFIPWAEEQPAEFVVVTWGNHDFAGHLKPNAEYVDKISLVSDGPILVNGIKLWLTPWSNQFMEWAWMKPHDQLAEIYAKIPEDIDILISHQPPYGFGDVYPNIDNGNLEHVGSSELLYRIERIKPKIVICGHLHRGYGQYQIGNTFIYNVSIVNEQYKLVNPATEIKYE